MQNTGIVVTDIGMGTADNKLQQLLCGKYPELFSQNGSLTAVQVNADKVITI